jgi:hypothetical protein
MTTHRSPNGRTAREPDRFTTTIRPIDFPFADAKDAGDTFWSTGRHHMWIQPWTTATVKALTMLSDRGWTVHVIDSDRPHKHVAGHGIRVTEDPAALLTTLQEHLHPARSANQSTPILLVIGERTFTPQTTAAISHIARHSRRCRIALAVDIDALIATEIRATFDTTFRE